jgi:hypothetical protein
MNVFLKIEHIILTIRQSDAVGTAFARGLAVATVAEPYYITF